MERTRRKLLPVRCLKFHRTVPASRLTPMKIQKRDPVPNATSQSPTLPMAKSRF
jgi:hypothetical protein